MISWKFHPFSENSVLVNLEGADIRHLHDAILNLTQHLSLTLSPYIIHLVPAYQSLMVKFNTNNGHHQVIDRVNRFLEAASFNDCRESDTIIEIPVCYDASLGTDLDKISGFANSSPSEAIALHTNKDYHVYMLGFLPGFAYMGEVDNRIAIPRKKTPVATKAGAVGIAGIQTGIYPFDSPGGWHIIGYTPLKMFDINRKYPSLLNPGDTVRFVEIDLDTYMKMGRNH